MTRKLSGHTALGIAAVCLIVAPALFYWPLLALTFEAGLLVGVFFHSAHSQSADIIDDESEHSHNQNV